MACQMDKTLDRRCNGDAAANWKSSSRPDSPRELCILESGNPWGHCSRELGGSTAS